MSVCPAIGGVEQVPGARNSVCVATASGVHDKVTGVAKLALVTLRRRRLRARRCQHRGKRGESHEERASRHAWNPPILAATCGVLPENSPP